MPFVHLAARFASEGHDVTLVTHQIFVDIVGNTFRVVPIPSDPRALMAGPAGRAARRWSPRELIWSRDLFADFVHSAYEPTRDALGDADVLIASTFALAAVDAALRQHVPVVRAHMWPEYSGLGGPMPLLPYSWHAPRSVRRLARRLLRRVEPYLGGVDGRWRRGRLHLVGRHPVGLTTATVGSLFAFSPHLVPTLPDVGVVTGWWTGTSGTAMLSGSVASALAAGEDWVYIGFGSMEQEPPAEMLQRLGQACERAGVRAVAQLGDVRGYVHPSLLCIGEEPHDELFRHVRAVVHHGGAGTTAAAVRAGVPSVVVPHFADQFYWGRRLQELGVAAKPYSRKSVSERTLAQLIGDALEPAMGYRAAVLADQVREEDGCGRAVHQVEHWLSGARIG